MMSLVVRQGLRLAFIAVAVMAGLAGATAAPAADEPDLALRHVTTTQIDASTYDITWRITATTGASQVALTVYVSTDGATTIDVRRGGSTITCRSSRAGMQHDCDLGPIAAGTPIDIVQRVRVGAVGHASAGAHAEGLGEQRLADNTANVTVGTPPPSPPPPPPPPPASAGDYALTVVEAPTKGVLDEEAVIRVRMTYTGPDFTQMYMVGLTVRNVRNARFDGPCAEPQGSPPTYSCTFGRIATNPRLREVSLPLVPLGAGETGLEATLNGVATGDANPGNNTVRVSFPAALPPSPKVLRGTSKRDYLIGTRFDDAIYGGAGNDALFGVNGNDRLDGGAGNDMLRPGPGVDTVAGGNGADTILAADRTRGDKIACGPGKDRVVADRGDRVARDCEVVRRA